VHRRYTILQGSDWPSRHRRRQTQRQGLIGTRTARATQQVKRSAEKTHDAGPAHKRSIQRPRRPGVARARVQILDGRDQRTRAGERPHQSSQRGPLNHSTVAHPVPSGEAQEKAREVPRAEGHLRRMAWGRPRAHRIAALVTGDTDGLGSGRRREYRTRHARRT